MNFQNNEISSSQPEISTEQVEVLKTHGLKVVESVTTPKKTWKKPRPVWVVSGNTYGLEDLFYDLGGKKYQGQWSFFDNPTNLLCERLQSTKRLSFEEQQEKKLERKEARIERFEGYSENAEERSNSHYQKVHAIGSMIPMGQPILVGHHSEKRHRRDLGRIDNGMRKSIEESKKAEYYSDKASRLEYEVRRNSSDRNYLGNRVKEAQAELSKLQRSEDRYKTFGRDEEYRLKIQNSTDALSFWQKSLFELESKLVQEGKRIATPENIKVGYYVLHRRSWYPVKRVNKKTVTISGWLSVESTFQFPYTDIQDYRSPDEVPQQK